MTRYALALLLGWAALSAHASSDPLEGLIAAPGGGGIGAAWRVERSPYRGDSTRRDFLPLFLYEGTHLYLHAYRAGAKVDAAGGLRFEAFLTHRFEGHPSEDVPEGLAGMMRREPGLDAGLGLSWRGAWGALYGEVMRDASANSEGAEARLGYRGGWKRGRLRLSPHAALAFRDAKLNDYYYGVLEPEARPGRPAYAPGAGVNLELGLFAAYSLTERWRLLGGLSTTRWSRAVSESPIVDARTRSAAVLGFLYDFSPSERQAWPEGKPLIARVFYGDSSDCDVAQIVRLSCTSTHTLDRTSIWGADIGRPLQQRLNGWPLDLAAFVGLARHKEQGFQPDFWQLRGYVKAYYYGFPWDARVRTRLALGAGLSYARRVPLMEVRDQALRGRGTYKLLTYLDPTLDVSVGDLLGVRRLRETYAGIGVSHRSGIFGTSQLLGNVNGGSNYIYGYLEASF